MSDGGKGSNPRPFSVPKEEFNEKWNKIFGDRPILAGYCYVCNKKYSWCSCVAASKELCEAIDKALGIERKKK